MNSVIGPEGSRPAPKHFVNGRNRIILSLLFIAVLIATVSFTVNDLFFAHAQSNSSPLATPAQLDQLNQQLAGRFHVVGQKSNALTPSAVPVYNNVGISNDNATTRANFDGAGNSYSFTSIINNSASTLAPGKTVQYNGMNLTMPNVQGGSPDNFLAQGQTVKLASPVTGAVRIGFIGSATNGPSCGTAFINYVGGNRQSFSLCLSDWTLNALHSPASYGNAPFGVQTYRNGRSGKQNVYTFLFYTETRVDPTQTVSSITLPSATTRGQLHVFTLGASAIEVDNNIGARHDNGTKYGTNLFANADGQYNAYSIEALHTAGMSQPDKYGLMHFKFNGVNFLTMDSYSDFPDNTVGSGQTIAYPSMTLTRLAFLGAATNGPQVGMATIKFTDGTKQTFQLGFNDWAAPSPLRYGNTIAMTMQYRNGLQGKRGPKVYMYYMQVTLMAGKTVASLTLPSNTNMHIFGFSAA
jgi:hypothetical protein